MYGNFLNRDRLRDIAKSTMGKLTMQLSESYIEILSCSEHECSEGPMTSFGFVVSIVVLVLAFSRTNLLLPS